MTFVTRGLRLGLGLENTWHAGHSPTYWTLGVFTVSGTAISVNTDPGCQARPAISRPVVLVSALSDVPVGVGIYIR